MLGLILLLAAVTICAGYAWVSALLHGGWMLVRDVSLGISFFLFAFMVVSESLFAINDYSLGLTLLLVALVAAVAAAILMIRRGPDLSAWSWRARSRHGSWMLLGILVVACGLTAVKFGFFGMGQDEGVYQTHALLLMNGVDNALVCWSDEFAAVGDSAGELVRADLADQRLGGGFYAAWDQLRFGTWSGVDPEKACGIYHGIPNFPALLSLSGMIFGAAGMMSILTVPYLVTIVVLYLTLDRNLRLSKLTTGIACGAFALSPLVLWVSKTSLTEIFLGLIMTVFLYVATSESAAIKALTWVPVAAFSFFHVSIYTLMPVFVVIAIYVMMTTRTVGTMVSAVLAVLSFGAGALAMTRTSPQYTFDNYRHLTGIFGRQTSAWGLYPIIAVVIVATLAVIVVVWLLVRSPLGERLTAATATRRRWASWLVPTAIIGSLAVIAYRWWRFAVVAPDAGERDAWFKGQGLLEAAPQLSLFAFAFSVGFVLLGVAIVGLIVWHRKLLGDDARRQRYWVIAIAFVYCVMLYAALLRPSLRYYYYFARYLAPFVPVVLLAAAVCLDRLRARWQAVVAVLTVAAMVPFVPALVRGADMINMDFHALGEVRAEVDQLSDDTVIVVQDGRLCQTLCLALQATEENPVFRQSTFKAVLAAGDFDESGPAVLITQDEIAGATPLFVTSAQLQRMDYMDGAHDTIHLLNLLAPASDGRYPIRIYALDDIDATAGATTLTPGETAAFGAGKFSAAMLREGWSEPEEWGTWTDEERAEASLRLPDDIQGDVQLSLGVHAYMPLGHEPQRVRIHAGRASLGEWIVGNQMTIEVTVPGSAVVDGTVTLTFELPDAISPAEAGVSTDGRTLGIGLHSIILTAP
ncbi:DUF7024 domain-containing protein [Microbacterium sp. CPCC 204701]|uniref:DUF7024 domain-containing protein n=1 Tax=Microbacterium sp. CPCC 204701 TaxID=2493084 RepID=UPI000FD8F48D|nr:hypothetical protein [Microbacterium sp. CPCC 204701]